MLIGRTSSALLARRSGGAGIEVGPCPAGQHRIHCSARNPDQRELRRPIVERAAGPTVTTPNMSSAFGRRHVGRAPCTVRAQTLSDFASQAAHLVRSELCEKLSREFHHPFLERAAGPAVRGTRIGWHLFLSMQQPAATGVAIRSKCARRSRAQHAC